MRIAPVLATYLVLCGTAYTGESPTRPAKVTLTDSDASNAAQDGHEVSICMTRLGVDYPVLLQKARAGELHALRLFIWLGHHAPLDGAAAEGYGNDLYRTAIRVSDAKFATAVTEQTYDVIRSCYLNLCYEVTQDAPESKKAADAVSTTPPKTIEAIQTATKSQPLWK